MDILISRPLRRPRTQNRHQKTDIFFSTALSPSNNKREPTQQGTTMASRASKNVWSTPSSPPSRQQQQQKQQQQHSGITPTTPATARSSPSNSHSSSVQFRTKDSKIHGNVSWLRGRRFIIMVRSNSKSLQRFFWGGLGCAITLWFILYMSHQEGDDQERSNFVKTKRQRETHGKSSSHQLPPAQKKDDNEQEQQQQQINPSLRSPTSNDVISSSFAPRYVSFFERAGMDENVPSLERLDLNMERYPSYREILEVTDEEIEAQWHLEDSKDYNHGREDAFVTDECKPQYDWQLTSFPTCNNVHEFHLDAFHNEDDVVLLTNGYWRDVWMVREQQHTKTKRVLKTIRYEHDYTQRNFDRHRRDAVAMERLTSSPFVVDIYGFCGNSGLFDYSTGGDVTTAIWPQGYDVAKNDLTNLQKLQIATQATIGVAAMHNNIKEGKSSMAHTDITPGQFIMIDGWYKLNDFNRVRFIRRNETNDKACGYEVGRNPGKNRAPEEYAYELQSEKVDVYSLGNIFYMLLTTWWPFEDVSDKEAKKLVKGGDRPRLPKSITESEDPITKALLEAMYMCHRQSQTERASAREVETFLMNKMKEIDGGTLAEWKKRYGSENLVIHK